MIQKITEWFSNTDQEEIDQPIDIAGITKSIKYEFENQDLLIQAVSHRSFYVDAGKQLDSNERLEFLGDAVLDLIVTEFLYKKFQNENEGLLSQKKAILVSRKALGKISEEHGFGKYLILNKGEEKTGGRKRLSNLANLFEAILGAIYLDGGMEPSKKFVESFLISRYKELLKEKTFFNYKSLLLEYAQSKGWGTPTYAVLEESGPDHQKTFLINVVVNENWTASGKGPNKKSAEQKAAKNTLMLISETNSEVKDFLKN
ncbi:MAG: ribonuclease III [Calditrichaeota bacterium]|nr:MAG: ribonuclease III [Calditrichota bacterium]MBL1203783.1 ribonuclease III [Calditrichota bacterium]NOG43613.1 ribonuclease III [Calditrichota bacterium]